MTVSQQRVFLVSPKTSYGRNLQRTYAGGLGTANMDEKCFLPPLDLMRLAAVVRAAGFSPSVVDEEVMGAADLRPGDIAICHVSLASMDEDAQRLGEFAAAGARAYAYTSIRRLDQWQRILTESGCEGLLLPEALSAAGRILHGEQDMPGLISSARAHDPGLLAHASGELADEPLPARDLVDHTLYAFPPLAGQRFTTMNASFGCPYPCGFYCPYPLGEGKKVRAYPVSRIAAEFEQCARLGITGVVFRDPIFTFDRRRALELCAAIKETGTGIKWWCETRIDRLDEELIEAMVAAGCVGVEVGVESGDARMQESAVRKRLTPEKVQGFLNTARERGLHILFLLIFGLPGETRQSIANTLKFITDLGLSSAEFNIGLITPYPGTQLHDLAIRNGWISGDQDQFTSYNAVMRTDDLTEAELTEALGFVEQLHRIDGGRAAGPALAEYTQRVHTWADAAPEAAV